MTAGPSDRRVKIRRTGRHTSPSQVEKVALTAGKAAPAVAIAGALVVPTAQQALAATDAPATVTAPAHATAAALTQLKSAATSLDSFATRTVTVASAKPAARHSATVKSTHYQVRPGDTLSSIAQHFYHRADAWQYLYHVNDKLLSDPNVIEVGENLYIPATAPAGYQLPDYNPKHATPVSAPVAAPVSAPASTPVTDSDSHATKRVRHIKTIGGTSDGGTVVVQTAANGDYSCSGLEQLWENAGGNPADAFMAAEIAMAESGGNPNAISPTDDYGLWQINASNGALATLDPAANAKSAIILSDNGTNWDPWTTYTAGLYYGKC